MNPIIVFRLTRYYMRSGMALTAAIKQAIENQQQSNKYGVKK